MKKKKIAILGASYLQLPLVLKSKELGFETHCFAWDNVEAICKDFSDFFYPISVLEKEHILQKCLSLNIDGITTIATDVCVPTISFVAKSLNLTSNSLETAIMATNKALMKIAFSENNVKTPKGITLDRFNTSFFVGLNFPLIVKPTDRSGSRGVTIVFDKHELESAFYYALNQSLEKKVVVEEYIDGLEVSVESISWKGNHYVLAITDKITTGEPHFVELEHHQPSLLSIGLQERIILETVRALEALKVEFGASHSEFKITEQGDIFAIEVGARMGGDFIGSHLVQLSTGYDYIKGVVEIAMGKFSEPTLMNCGASGVYFLTGETAYLKKYFQSHFSFEVKKEKLKQDIKISSSSSNDRAGYIIYKNDQRIILK